MDPVTKLLCSVGKPVRDVSTPQGNKQSINQSINHQDGTPRRQEREDVKGTIQQVSRARAESHASILVLYTFPDRPIRRSYTLPPCADLMID